MDTIVLNNKLKLCKSISYRINMNDFALNNPFDSISKIEIFCAKND